MRFAPLPAGLPATVPFIGPEELERRRGVPFAARLGANESAFGPSPLAARAMREAVGQVWKYGDAPSHELTHALADHHRVAPGNILVGEGIDGLLGNLVRLMVAPGDAVVTSDGAYPTFNYHVAGFGGVLHKVPYRDDAEDPEALLERAHATGARLIYLANPDNPMGSWHEGPVIEAMLDRLPPDCLLVLDEAYAEFAPAAAVPRIAADDPRVIRMRTFSKAYGLAGARIGYAMGAPELIAGFARIRNHFGVNRIAQAGALAALADPGWLAHVVAEVAAARDRIAAIAAANGLTALPSATNFVALDTGRDGDHARALIAALAGEGVFARMPGTAPLDRCIRISAAPIHELDVLEDALPRAMDRAG
ncbi:pyridoxal phosphate-dependent aminotransferase [Paracoccus aestuarii]|uniref:histidinol-phosphate transaminase n=1 Tax=Paracoccus aestuarii TaxID=453842 RepID=A0A419A283_9RHOB|nr:pyridoxal phosphate-dependent aminotransferase [Paracoccus aestuarii]RJL07143.1 pyridoxal phosphate-dependent aminotransferase [Paracoccus aestuarii]WCQ99552.1 pyridoxal phosphate-dependent aminotransferase [Paracoccus aestuarii]